MVQPGQAAALLADRLCARADSPPPGDGLPESGESRCWDHSNVASLSTGCGDSRRGRDRLLLLSFHFMVRQEL